MNDTDELVRDFLIESHENLNQLDQDLVALEQNPRDEARLGSVFRTIHTIKGTCGFFGFSKLELVAHVGENLLCRLRDGELLLNAEITSALLALVDAIRQMLDRITSTGKEGDADYTKLVTALTRLAAGKGTAGAVPSAPPDALSNMLVQEIPVSQEISISALLAQAVPPAARSSSALTTIANLTPTPKPTGPPAPRTPSPEAALPVAPAPKPVAAEPADARPAPALPADAGAAPTAQSEPRPGAAPQADTNIRVDVGLLDKLMNLVGELVLARNQILQFTAGQKDPGILRASQRLNLITTELQEGVMKTRMQPIGTVWNRFPRVVRDLAAQCGKQVRIEMEGQHTELDRTIIEAIKDPLTHIIRNSVDHGIEPPALRLATGKPAEGRLHLRAYHEGGQVNIEITDDGGGIDPERVRDKALSRGLIDRDQAARMTERELIQLVFYPGFSTAEKVTSVSGRGVGMDVVKTNIEKIGGAIDLQSVKGKGTTLKVKIPLTLAIIPALIVTTDGDRYCIPQVSLLELVRLEGDEARGGIERVHDVLVYRLREQLLPLVDLSEKLHLPTGTREVINIVVLQADGQPFGLIVDGVNDTEEIVVKPLGKHFKGLTLFAGATIMGDGKVALILDVLGLAQEAAVMTEGRERRRTERVSDAAAAPRSARRLLLAQAGSRRLAIPLDLVARLEEVRSDAIEDGGGQPVVQYRDRIMPLVRVGEFLGCATPAPADPEMLQVVVYAHDDCSVGLVVDQILDVVESDVELHRAARRNGVEGPCIIQDRVTDLLDLRALVESAVPDLFAECLT